MDVSRICLSVDATEYPMTMVKTCDRVLLLESAIIILISFFCINCFLLLVSSGDKGLQNIFSMKVCFSVHFGVGLKIICVLPLFSIDQ